MIRSRMPRRITALLCALALLFACGCGSREKETAEDEEIILSETLSGKTLTGTVGADKIFSMAVDFDKSLNPLRTTSSASLQIAGLVYDNLFEVDANYGLSTRLLTDYVVNDDGNFWTLTVDTSIPMHDGSHLTAYDVAYSIQRAMMYSSYFASRLTSVAGVSAYQDDQLCISTRYPDTRLPYRLTIPVIKQGSILSLGPAGSGPYMFSHSVPEGEPVEPTPDPTPEPEDPENKDGEEVEEVQPDILVAFPGYGGEGKAPVDTIYLRPYSDPASMILEYENALVDLVVNDPTGSYNVGYGGMNEKRVYPTTHMHYIGFNGYSDFFCYGSYRRVLNWLIDRQYIADSVMDGNATASPFPVNPACPLYNATLAEEYSFNSERAYAELETLGCRDLDDDGQLEFTLSGSKIEININFIVCADSSGKVSAARRIADEMQALGFPVTLQEVSWKDFQYLLANPKDEDTGKATFDMYYDEVALSADWDVMPFLEEGGKLNYGQWNESALNAAVQAYMAADATGQREACDAMCRQVCESAVFLPVCFEKRIVISHLGAIRGMNPNQYNLFSGVTGWTINMQ